MTLALIISPTAARCIWLRLVVHHCEKFGPAWLRRFLIKYVPNRAVRKLRDITDTMDARSREIVDGKLAALKAGDEALKHQVGEGKDIMSILCECRTSDTVTEWTSHAHISESEYGK